MQLSFADGLFWTSVACCALAQLCILRSVGVRHHVPEPTAAMLPRSRGTLEVLWAVVPALALAAVLVFTWRAMHAAPRLTPASGAIAARAR